MARINIKQPYSDTQVDQLYQLLIGYERDGNPRDYEIFLNDMPLLPKSKNLDFFRNYEGLLNDKTRNLLFRVHHPETKDRNYDRYEFTFGADKALNGIAGSLSGLDDEGLAGFVAKEVEKNRKDWDNKLLKKNYAEAQERIKELEEELDGAEEEINELKGNSEIKQITNFLGKITGDLAPTLINRFLPGETNPNNLGTLPPDPELVVSPEQKALLNIIGEMNESDRAALIDFIVGCRDDATMINLIK